MNSAPFVMKLKFYPPSSKNQPRNSAHIFYIATRPGVEKALRATMPDAAAKMGIRESNLRWYAAFHQARGHPHVHIVFREDVPERTRGKLSQGERKDVRKTFIRQIYAEERRLAITTENIRDIIRQSAQKDVLSIVREIKDSRIEVRALTGREPGLAPFLDQHARKDLLRQLKELSEMMPGYGRATLKYMPYEIKDKARETAKDDHYRI